MNDQQRMSRRAYDDAAKLRNQATSDVINRANKLHIKQHQDAVDKSLKAGRRTGENVADGMKGAGVFIFVFMVIGIFLFALFALFVLIVLGLQRSPFG